MTTVVCGCGADVPAGADCSACAEARRLSRLLWDAREAVEMYADIVESRGFPSARKLRDLVAGIDEYRAGRGWSPGGFGGEAGDAPSRAGLVHVGWWCDRASGHVGSTACNSGSAPLYTPARDAQDVKTWLEKEDGR